MTREEVVRKVNRSILAEFDVEEEDLRPEARLADDLDLDSLDGIDLVVAVEKEFKENRVKILEGAVREMKTLKDIYDYVEKHIAASS